TSAESFTTAAPLGMIRDKFLIASGNTTYMSGDYPASITGCGADGASPEVVYRFTIDKPTGWTPTSPAPTIDIGVNTRFDATANDFNNGNAYGPPTAFPVVVT